jgi:RNA polymerase sigma-70 factor (family 1)
MFIQAGCKLDICGGRLRQGELKRASAVHLYFVFYNVDNKTRADINHLQLRLARGDEGALKQLYDCFAERLLHFAFAIVHQREQAEEVVADVFIQVWQKRVRIADLENFTSYLYTIARNISLNYLRKDHKGRHINIEDVYLPYYQVEPTAVDHLVTAELLQHINNAINELPPKCRLIFKLIKEDGLQYKEVAALLGISLKTVENQMGIALKKLHAAVDMHMPVIQTPHKQGPLPPR